MPRQMVCLGNLVRTGRILSHNMANWLDGKLARNNESQRSGGFHSQAVHSWPDKGILYTAPTPTHWTPTMAAWPRSPVCVLRLEKDHRQTEQTCEELELQSTEQLSWYLKTECGDNIFWATWTQEPQVHKKHTHLALWAHLKETLKGEH